MTAMNLPVAPPTPERTVDDDGKEHVKIRFGVFNDGTLNNRTNTDARLITVLTQEDAYQAKANGDARKMPYLTAEERKAAEELLQKMSDSDRKAALKAYRKHGAPPPSTSESSYEGYYSNVAKMEPHVNTAPIPAGAQAPLTHRFSTYVEGIGTDDYARDQVSGSAFGDGVLLWRTGILDKVKKAMGDIVRKIDDQFKKEKTKIVIDEIIVDVFGFSRGAAASRKLIFDVLFGKNDTSLLARLDAQGYTVIKVNVCFAGLYDSVSTFGSGIVGKIKTALGLANNVKELNLNAVRHAEEALHLTAADEHRFHFSLTNIKSAEGKGKEIALPGVHADIGGGYRDGVPETWFLRGSPHLSGLILQGNYPSLEEAERERAQFIAAGWYRDSEKEITVTPVLDHNGDFMWATVWAHRAAISNKYSLIPLHLMAKAARNKGIELEGRFDKDEKIPPELEHVRNEIDDYIATTPQSNPEDWHDNKRPWLRRLRYDYLHFSARMEVGYDPRINEQGERERYTYDG